MHPNIAQGHKNSVLIGVNLITIIDLHRFELSKITELFFTFVYLHSDLEYILGDN